MSTKKKIIIVSCIFIVVLIFGFIFINTFNKKYMSELKYNELMEKVDKKESFILCISQTFCEHCKNFKPKLEHVASNYKLMVYYIDVDLLSDDEKNSLKEKFNYSATPTTIFVVDGEEKTAATRINGDASEEKILNKFKSNGFVK